MTSQESVYFVMVMSIFSSVGRVGSGWIADRPWSDTIIINSVTLMIGGLATVFVPFYKSFGVIVVYCIIIGISLGKSFVLLNTNDSTFKVSSVIQVLLKILSHNPQIPNLSPEILRNV